MWTPQAKVECVAWFIEAKSDVQVRRNFGTQYGREPPSRPTIRAWYASVTETSSVGYKLGESHPSVSEANIAFGYRSLSLRTRLHTQLSLMASTFFYKFASLEKLKNFELTCHMLKTVYYLV
ncbi:hypothetical protein AVEN_264703-1 [Araneus ventricosus]|uniref:Uncharacterized protein n=1 Tax=Araneus ventricosus TaxID=182803 RepID=A0A4Y2WG98_ARAVE|nr:hypothetical protein AVEN_264703-1 [Araneus ventricosus]